MLPDKWSNNPWLNWVENRWVRLFTTIFTLFFATVLYYGWQQFRHLLHDNNYLGYLCPEDTVDFPCHDQKYWWDMGYTLASTMEFSFGLFAGVMFDHVGPFITAFMGLTLFFISWFIIAFCSSDNKYIWITGCILCGTSINFTAFPSFILIDIFPNHKVVMAAVVLGSQVSATGVMPVLYSISTTTSPPIAFDKIMLVYLLCVTLPFCVLYLFTLPLNRKQLQLEYKRRGLPSPPTRTKPDWAVFLKCLMTWEYLGFTVWYAAMLIQYNYYGTALADIVDETTDNVIGWLFFLQGPVAVAFGYLNDKIRTIPCAMILTAMQVYAFSCIWMGSAGAYLGGLMYVISNAHVFTTKFAYTGELFPHEHYGKLAGLVGLLAGLLQLINNPIRAHNVDEHMMFTIFTAVTVPQFLVLMWLAKRGFIDKKSYHHYSSKINENPGGTIIAPSGMYELKDGSKHNELIDSPSPGSTENSSASLGFRRKQSISDIVSAQQEHRQNTIDV